MAPQRPIICLDFDGVIHGYESGWKGAHIIPDPPVPGAMDFLRELYETGKFDCAIYSSRSRSLRGRWAMQKYVRRNLLLKFGFQAGPHMDPLFLEISEWLKWPWFKPPALVTLDDRAITFSGTFPSFDALAQFKPWNKP